MYTENNVLKKENHRHKITKWVLIKYLYLHLNIFVSKIPSIFENIKKALGKRN